MKYQRLVHRFVTHLPDTLEPGVLYVAPEFGTVSHLCCCGCGEEVVTPLTPTDWYMTFDGESISLHPSVGSWTLRCRSHYVIRRGRVFVAPAWTEAQIAAERMRDSRAKAHHYGGEAILKDDRAPIEVAGVPEDVSTGLWSRLTRLFGIGSGKS